MKKDYTIPKTKLKKSTRKEMTDFAYDYCDSILYANSNTVIHNLLVPYEKWKFDEFNLLVNNQKVPIQGFALYNNYINRKNLDKIATITSPNFINNRLFWEKIGEDYRFVPILGSECSDMNELHRKALIGANNSNVLKYLQTHLIWMEGNCNILEIGYGYGTLRDYFKKMYPNVNYKGIDIIKRVEGDDFYECDGLNIPEDLKKDNYHLAFSSNVFQHLTIEQRYNYLEQVYDLLVENGVFVFSSFVVTKENKKDKRLWGFKDRDGVRYCYFFGQLTEVEHLKNIKYNIREIGFEISKIDVENGNHLTMSLVKKKKPD